MMSNQTAKLLVLNVLNSGAAADTSASFTATTTGAQTLTINALTVSAATTVDWGDGSSDVYTGSGARTHNYAGAGTWTVRILEPLNVTTFRMNATPIATMQGSEIQKFANLTSLIFKNFTGISWTVGPSAPLPTGLTTLQLTSTSGISWTVGASAPIPTGLTELNIIAASGVSIVSTLDACLALDSVTIKNNLSDAAQNTILSQLYAAFPSRTASNGTIDLLGGGNAVSGGILQAACPPTTTREIAYELTTDSCGVSSKHWASVSLQT